MVEGVVHSAPVGELDDAFTLALVVNVGVRDLAGGPEVIFQVLPRRLRGDVLNDDPVVGPRARRISSAASVPIAESTFPASAPRILGKLDAHSASFEVLAVEIMNSVIGVPVVKRTRQKMSRKEIFGTDFTSTSVLLNVFRSFLEAAVATLENSFKTTVIWMKTMPAAVTAGPEQLLKE